MMIEDNDILFLSNGDDFIPPLVDRSESLNWDKTVPSTISGYRIGKVLGRGGFGEVRVGEHHLTGERVALKFLRKSEIISMGAAERTTTEIQCLSALKHANIIRLQQVSLKSPLIVDIIFSIDC
jgi:serine/threonine protein kinase